MTCPFIKSELDIIELFSKGFTAEDIAHKINKPFYTIIDRVKKMKSKADAYNTVHLVAIALREGWIK